MTGVPWRGGRRVVLVALLVIVFLVLIALDYVVLWYPWAPVDIGPALEGSPIIEPPRPSDGREGAAGSLRPLS